MVYKLCHHEKAFGVRPFADAKTTRFFAQLLRRGVRFYLSGVTFHAPFLFERAPKVHPWDFEPYCRNANFLGSKTNPLQSAAAIIAVPRSKSGTGALLKRYPCFGP